MVTRIIAVFMVICAFLLPVEGQVLNAPTDLRLTLVSDPVVNNDSRTIRVQFIVEDDGVPIVDLTESAITLNEAAQDIDLSTANERTLHLAIAVDLSFGSDADLIRGTLRAFFDNYYLPQDVITLYILDAAAENSDDFRTVSIDSLATATALIDSLQSAEQLFSTKLMLLQIAEDLQTIPDTLRNSRQVLLVGSFFNRPSDRETVRDFTSRNITVHGVQAHRTRQDATGIYREFVETGNGLYANNIEGILVIPGDAYQPINTLKVLYDTIANSRVVYTLSWVTRSASLDRTRTVNLALTLPASTVIEASLDYTFEFSPPQIEFTNQIGFDVQRTITRMEDLSLTYSMGERAVPIAIRFPDEVTRTLNSLRLQVRDANTGEILQSDLVLEPTLSDNRYTFIWNLSEYTVADSVTDVELVVTAVDELGLQSEATAAGSVRLGSIPPLPTATPTATPTSTPTVTPVPVVSTALDDKPPLLTGVTENLLSPIGGLLALLIVLLMLLMIQSIRLQRIARNNQAAFVASAAPIAVPRMTQTITAIEEDTAPPEVSVLYAQLVPSSDAAKKLVDESILVDKRQLRIGRSAVCDVVVDSPILNDEHCVITIKNKDEVYVRDLNSINGTFINGERLQDQEDHFMPLHSELSLTRQLTFDLWEPGRELFETDQHSTAFRSTVVAGADNIPFKPLQGLRYAPDDGPAIEDNYSPL